jgi:hypothetical protein
MSKLWLFIPLVLTATVFATGASADPGTQSELTAIAGQGLGRVELAPTAQDVVAPDTFDVQGTVNIRHAAAGTAFTVLRRVDFIPDGVCTGETWAMLPPPNEQALTTSSGGGGALHFEISRGAPLTDGVIFDVQWRLEGTDGSILESDCLTVTVK